MKAAFIVNIPIKDRDGRVVGTKQVIRYEGLLARAHEDGLRSIATRLIQTPSKENGDVAIVHAVAVTNRGTFEALGDASPSNVNARMTGALLRVAETRAKARSLRDAVNIGIVALEELDDEEESAESEPPLRAPAPTVTAPANGNTPTAVPAAERGVAIDDIHKWLENHYGLKPIMTWSKVDASRLIERLKGQNGHSQAASS